MATVSMKVRSIFVVVAIVVLLEAGQAAGRPGIRVSKLSPVRLGIRHTCFSWYLVLSVANYVWWTFYSWPCKYGQATFPIKWTSFMGLAIHLLLVWLMLFKLVTPVALVRSLFVVALAVFFGVIASVIASAAADAAAIFGWIGMGLSVLSHFFRIKATDYDSFDWILFGASVIGMVNGFLWLHHPSLCVARQYKITSYLIAALRGLETLQWLWPWIRDAMMELQGGPEVPVNPRNRNVNRNTELTSEGAYR
ncbi:hypothetical protein EJB05_57023 [Eragrostis curvula]|uniref:Uncharacterized protein n=1 Tax=Eragrostis curvula TaxID=38414 RepID=A0A5J9SEM7_9POAL|nr:hypothetical protein EJB05_57023 [Eragrostis curvula]